MEFSVPLLTLLRLQSYLVPCISARIFIIPRLQNIHCIHLYLSELFSLCIERLPNCYSGSSRLFLYAGPELAFREHISRALPSEMIFHLLQSIPSKSLLWFPVDSGESHYHLLEVIIKWLQVSVSECNRQTPQTKKSNLYLTGTWFRATKRLV